MRKDSPLLIRLLRLALLSSYLLLLLSALPCLASVQPSHIDISIWSKVRPHLLPDDHPLKEKLDRIFERGRPLASTKELTKAGFRGAKKRKYTGVIVTSHPELPGVLIKAYTDDQRYHHRRPEWVTWLCRIYGARLLQREISRMGWSHWFSTPQKWIYAVPHPERSALPELRKDFILVVEDKQLLPDAENRARWHSRDFDKEMLRAFFTLVTRVGVWDCAKMANAPFCRDGKIAFVDTESFARWPVLYEKLTKHLASSMKEQWCTMAGEARTIVRSRTAEKWRKALDNLSP